LKRKPAPSAIPELTREENLLTEIRDTLKSRPQEIHSAHAG
jgi:hypothetical protein